MNPCGFVTGVSRFAYTTKAYFFRDNPSLETTIKVYFASDNAPTLPFATIFGPNNHLEGEFLPFPGIDQENVEYYNGQDVWGCPATTFTGSADQWRRGALTTDPVPEYNEEGNCPLICGCDPTPIGDCVFVPFAAGKRCQVTVTGATGTPAIVNGTYLLDYVAGCQWFWTSEDELSTIEVTISNELFPTAYIACVLLFDTVSTGFYELTALVDFYSPVTLDKGNANAGWPLTIEIKFVSI